MVALISTIVFWLSLGVLAYTFVGYSALMGWLARGRKITPPALPDDPPAVTVVVVAHNEESRIGARLENLLGADYPPGKLRVLLVSDGSTDATVERARAFDPQRVSVHASPTRAGKAAGLNAALAHAMVMGQSRVPPKLIERIEDGIWLVPTAWIFAALWNPLTRLRQRLGFHERPPEADVLVVLGTLILAELSALSRIPLHLFGVEAVGPEGRTISIVVIVVLLAAAAFVGWLWRFEWWLACAVVFFAITVPLYMSMGTNPGGVGGLFWNSLSYWLDQQEVRRGTQPWFYYLMMVPLYEMLTLIPALIGGMWLAVRRQDHFAVMLLWWFVGTFIALSIAGEKMPWLTVHMAVPLALLAGYVLDGAIRGAVRHVREGSGSILAWAGGGVAITAMALALIVTIRTDIGLNINHSDTPVEPLIYVQSTPEMPRVAAEIRQHIAEGRASSIVLDDSEGAGITWPWAWYLRHEGILYTTSEAIQRGEFDQRAIVIRVRGERSAPPALVSRPGDVTVYRHRWWFPEETYREITWNRLTSGILDGSLLREWAQFIWYRGEPALIASLDSEVYFPAQPTAQPPAQPAPQPAR